MGWWFGCKKKPEAKPAFLSKADKMGFKVEVRGKAVLKVNSENDFSVQELKKPISKRSTKLETNRFTSRTENFAVELNQTDGASFLALKYQKQHGEDRMGNPLENNPFESVFDMLKGLFPAEPKGKGNELFGMRKGFFPLPASDSDRAGDSEGKGEKPKLTF